MTHASLPLTYLQHAYYLLHYTNKAVFLNNPMNDNNLAYYQKIDLQAFKQFAHKQGIDACKDMEVIKPHLKPNSIVVELGSGYGRVLQWLQDQHFKGKIIAIERVAEFINILKRDFRDAIELHSQDLKKLTLTEPADTFLWLWSGILEYSPEEQQSSISKIFSLLKKGGKLFIEMPSGELHVVGKFKNDNYIKVEDEWGTIEAYLPSEQEMFNYAHNAGFDIKVTDYKTGNNFNRRIYQLTKP